MVKDNVINLIKQAAREKKTELDLSGNQLTSLPPEIASFTNLTELNLSGNQLTSLPPEIASLTNLTELNLSGNQLTSLPSEIITLKYLTLLDIVGNKFTSLPSEIKELTNLRKISIGNHLSLSKVMGEVDHHMEDIQELIFCSFPLEIKELQNLTHLELYGVQFTSLPPEIKELKNLTYLKLNGNQLTSLPPEIKELKNLKGLDLSWNKLTSLPSEIKELKNLTMLNLGANKLTFFPSEVKELKNLTTLILWGNQLTTVPSEIKELKNLTTLDIHDNRLTSITSEIKSLKNLNQLNLTWNKLISLPPEITEIGLDIKLELVESLGGILVDSNPLQSPPLEIVEKGRQAIIDYFRSLEGEKQPLNEVKLLLVGAGGAGKTSLVKQLLKKEFDEKELQTDGINITQWGVNDTENKIKVHIWDFGGQEIMHSTHQFFLSKRSLYILVLDGRKDEKPEYWLKHIESFGGNSPILVIINKVDENPSFEVDRLSLQEKYKGIRGFYRLSCKNGDGIESLKNGLSKELENVGLRKTPFAKSWFNIKTQLENLTEPFLSYDQFKEMCIKEKITEKSAQDTLVGFLHDLGVILHFKDIDLLDTHVLEPEWVTTAVYKIINSKKLAESKGVLKLDLLNEILKKEKETDFYYPPDKYRYIINLMKKFELCYELSNQRVLIPGLLEVPKPKFDFNYDNSLKFIIQYDFLPKSIMPRFIVKRHSDIKSKLQWRTGVVLEDKELHTSAVVIADEDKEKIYIYVSGERKKEYFSIIRKTLREINQSFEKLEAKELVPLPDNDKITIEYEELVGYDLENRDEYFNGILRKGYSVKQLLNGIEKEEERMTLDSDKRTVHVDKMVMGDNYEAKQVVSQGPEAHLQDINIQQIWNEKKDEIDLRILTKELAELRQKLLEYAKEPEHYNSIANVASAEDCAKKGNGQKAFEHLSKAGNWVLDTATKIGIPVATAAIVASMG